MLQAPMLDGLSFDPFSFQQDGLAPPEVDVGRGQIVQALMIAVVVVVGDEGLDKGGAGDQVMGLEQAIDGRL